MNHVHGRIALACAAISVWYCGGCERPAPLIDLGSEAQPASPMAPGTLEVELIEPSTWDGIRPPIGRDLLRDRDLASFAAQGAAWAVYGDAAAIRVDAAGEGPADGAPVTFTAASETRLSQTTSRLPAVTDAAWVRTSVWARCDSPDSCYLAIGHEADGGAAAAKVFHPGDGEWRELRIWAPYVWSLQPGELTLTVGSSAPASFLGPALSLSAATAADRAAANGHGDEWIANGSFEDYGASGGYFPWRMNAWRGAAGAAEAVRTGDGPDGAYAASLGRPEGAMRLFQRLPDFDGSYAGKRYRARAWAKSAAAGDSSLTLRVTDRSGAALETLSPTAAHPGDGQWRELTAEIVFPEDPNAYPLTVFVDLVRRNADPGAVLFDGASFRGVEP